MAHMIEMVGDNASMAFAGDVPWHGLGVQVGDNLTPNEIMKAANCDWRVHEVETFAEFNGERISTGMKALVRDRDNAILTQVGENWNPVQNEEAFEFFSEFVSAGDMKMHTAGSLKNGKVVWALAKVADDFELFGGDKVESYLLFSNPHEYGRSIDVRFTPIRVVCNNTLTLSLKGHADNAVRLNHRKKFDAEEVKRLMKMSNETMVKYKEAAELLGSKRAQEDDVKEYFAHLLGTSSKNENELTTTGKRLMELISEQPGAGYAEGSWWQVFNSLTYWTDHEAGRTSDARLTSAWYGANRKLKTEALNKALEMVS